MANLVPAENGCMVWPGVKPTRYGYILFQGTKWRTHRLVWTLLRGPIPDGLWVLHRCDNPPCANVDHLFLGDQKANMADAVAKGRHGHGTLGPKVSAQSKVVACPQGHPYDDENTYIAPSGKRECRACRRESARAWKERNPEKVAAKVRAWKERNPEAVRAHQARWKARRNLG